MIDTPTIVNTCYETTSYLRTIAEYSHLIPVFLSLSLAIVVIFKAKFNLFSKIFLAFVSTFSLWLIGDLIIWTSNNYDLVYAVWSTLDYIEITFYILGLYFILVFAYEKDLSVWFKLLLFLIILIPFGITVTGQSVVGFDQSVCEALNNNFLTIYKLVIEILILVVILAHILRSVVSNQKYETKKANLIVMGSLFIFLSIFGGTEYFASVTGIYETNLYSLFILPVFLIAIIYAVFELDIFHFNLLGTHYLVGGLVLVMGGQLFFINNETDRLLTVLTIIIGIAISILLFRNLKRESDQRIHIENLSRQLEKSKMRLEDTNLKLEDANDKLQDLDKLKTEFLGLASHQLRSPLTAIKGYASMLLEGDFGDVPPKAKEAVNRIMQSSQNLTLVVEDLLNVSKIEQGGMKYEMTPFNFADMVRTVATDLAINAKKKGLELYFKNDNASNCIVNGDEDKLRQVVVNFIDNAIKYTKEGSIDVSVYTDANKVLFSVKDTGMGMTPDIKASLFQKFSRGDGARMNTSGSGLGLYLAKEIVYAHKGTVRVESDGPNKGSVFSVELEVYRIH